jgi:imidazole glycerol-phosphate synthase subunit HisH
MSGSKMKISIVDYGVGNLYSVLKAFKFFTDNVRIAEETEELKKSDAIILPGVGSFEAGMQGLKTRNLINPVKEFARSGKPMLGICLGAQIMMTKGYEFGNFSGLNLIEGQVIAFPKLQKGTKVPHIGWNNIYIPKDKNKKWKGTILESATDNSSVYFVHSYVLKPENNRDILASTSYGGYNFCSAFKRDNIYGCQFHPEKSARVGLTIIKNFITLVR